MNKYVRAAICITFTDIKLAWLKVTHRGVVIASIINICSPFSEITISQHGKLSIGNIFKMRSYSHIRIRHNGVLTIGDNTSLNYNDIIICHENISIGNNVQLSPNVQIYDHDHDYKAGLKNLKYKTSPIIIGNDVWIGANSVILRGSVIGNGAVIGAGCIIKGKIPANTVVIQKRDSESILHYGDE